MEFVYELKILFIMYNFVNESSGKHKKLRGQNLSFLKFSKRGLFIQF